MRIMLKQFFKNHYKYMYFFIICIFIIIIFVYIFNILSLKDKEKDANPNNIVFNFKGGNEFISLNNGLIKKTNNKYYIFGGNINYNGVENKPIKFYSNKLYIKKSGNIKMILTNSVYFKEEDFYPTLKETLDLNQSIGEISSEDLFNNDDLEYIKENLFWKFQYKDMYNEVNSIEIKLEVN